MNTLSAETILRNYFHAKDENRPRLLEHVFAADAALEIGNASSAISFPATTQGRTAIADVLVREFGRNNDDVWSFYLQRPPAACRAFRCGWLVAMTEKASGAVRVGCGTYDWSFAASPSGLATRLAISIDAMEALPAADGPAIYGWVGALDYPWSSASEAIARGPALDRLQPVLAQLTQLTAAALEPRASNDV